MHKTNRKVTVVAGIVLLVLVGLFLTKILFFDSKNDGLNSYDPLKYGPDQQVECVISDIERLKENNNHSRKSISEMLNTALDHVEYSELSDFDNSISREKLLSSEAAFNHYGLTIFKLGNKRSYGKNDSGDKTYIESLWGVRVQTEGSMVYCTPYNHEEAPAEIKKIDITRRIGYIDEVLTSISADWDKRFTLNFLNCNNGVYNVRIYLNGELPQYMDCEIVCMDSNAYTCCSSGFKKIQATEVTKRLSKLHRWTDNLNPKDYLSLEGLTYPSSGETGVVNNVKDIAKFSHTLIKDEWTDEYKVYVFTDWLIKNVAYDMWRYRVNNGESRAHKYKNYTKPEYFMWTNHVGVCWDYTNALAIMCRENGIPSTSIDTETHTWNLVYLNGQWESIDLCGINLYYSYDEKPDKNKWVNCVHDNWNDYAIVPDSMIYGVISTNDQMWTYEAAYGIR